MLSLRPYKIWLITLCAANRVIIVNARALNMQLNINNRMISIEFDRCSLKKNMNYAIKNNIKGYVCTINSNLLCQAYLDNKIANVLENSIYNVCDGTVLAKTIGKIYRKKYQSYPGPDYFHDIIVNNNLKYCFLGNTSEVLNKLKINIKSMNNSLEDCIYLSLPYNNVDSFDYIEIAHIINSHEPDIIFISLGAPKQELFAAEINKYLKKGISICVGAAFDFHAGQIKRAPKRFRNWGLEWLWRIYTNPQKTLKRLYSEFYIMPRVIYKMYRDHK